MSTISYNTFTLEKSSYPLTLHTLCLYALVFVKCTSWIRLREWSDSRVYISWWLDYFRSKPSLLIRLIEVLAWRVFSLTLSSSCCCRSASYSIVGWASWVKAVLVSCSHGHSSSCVSQNWQTREWALSSCRQRSEFSWLTTLYFSDSVWSFICMTPQPF